MRKTKNDFWSFTGDFIFRHHVEPRVKMYTPKEESCPIPLKHIDVTRTTHTSLDVLLETQIDDHWNVEIEREPSDAWTGFTRFMILDEKPLDGYTWSWRRQTSKPDNVWPDMWKHLSDASKRKQKSAIEKAQFDNARRLRIELDDEEFKRIMKNARRKFEIPMPAAMPCKTPRNSGGETYCRFGKSKTENACIVAADEPTRKRLGVLHRYHEDHQCKRDEFYNSLESCSQIRSDASSLKNSRCKACSGERMGKTGEHTSMAADKNQKQKRSDR